MTYSLFTTCPRGLESVLVDEMQQQGANRIHATDGGVACFGTLETAYRLNLFSRTASRVLLQLASFPYRSEDDLYRAARNTKWEDWFHPAQTFKIKTEAKRTRIKSLG